MHSVLTSQILSLCKEGSYDYDVVVHLLDILFAAHIQAARDNQNISSQAVKMAGAGNGCQLNLSIMAGLACLGQRHGPVTEARQFLELPQSDTAKEWLERSRKLPGWGNSFYRSVIDPAWVNFEAFLRTMYPKISERIAMITDVLWKADKRICPNAACFTAATAIILNLKPGLEPLLMILPRICVWAEFSQQTQGD